MQYIKSTTEIKTEQERKVERIVEHNMNWLDHKLMNNRISQKQYDKEVQELDSWAKWAIKLGE